MLSYAILLLYVSFGIVIGIAFFMQREILKGVISCIAGAIPLLYILLFPFDFMDYQSQLGIWQYVLAAVWLSGLALVVVTFFVRWEKKIKNLAISVCIVLTIVIFSTPVHRQHDGWGSHGHFIWENPFHLH